VCGADEKAVVAGLVPFWNGFGGIPTVADGRAGERKLRFVRRTTQLCLLQSHLLADHAEGALVLDGIICSFRVGCLLPRNEGVTHGRLLRKSEVYETSSLPAGRNDLYLR
jgi:hypothetical protein